MSHEYNYDPEENRQAGAGGEENLRPMDAAPGTASASPGAGAEEELDLSQEFGETGRVSAQEPPAGAPYGYGAYSAPGGQGGYAPNIPQPNIPYAPQPQGRPPKSGGHGVLVFCIILACVLVLSLASLAVVGFVSYFRVADPGTAQPGVNEPTQGGTSVQIPIAETPEFVPAQADEPLSVREIAAKVKPSVVGIVMQLQNGTGMASGVIVTEDGYILTNAHVVDGAQVMTVVLDDENKTQYTAQLVGVDEATELAVIKIDATGLPAAEFGDSTALVAGDQVVAIGNPGGLQFQNTVTVGWVSAINREMTLDDGRQLTLIQHDAAINTGNSGGALVNVYGQVVGVNSIKYAPSYYEGLGFAIPMSTAKPVVEQLIAQGYVSGRPLLGITGQNISQMMAQASNIPMGVYVVSVNEDSDAYAKGVREGDIIVGVGDVRITTMDELNAQKAKYQAGDTMQMTIYRGGREITVNVRLSEAKPTAAQ